jgi:putative spermidine/putrescine transport system ATP-binding protein
MSELSLTGVGKRYGNSVALADVSLHIKPGEFICLLGESGCGKTTLLRVIAGLVQHEHGDITLAGSDLSGVPCHKRNIGMVFQSLALFPHLNVGANIAYGLRMRGAATDVTQQRVDHLLQLVGLADYGARSVASLSGGQKQRVAIARALAMEPQLFLMDEPFSALDAGLRDHLQQEVRKIQQQLAVTTIFVTHDQREAMSLADRIVVMNNGRIEQVGTPEEIYQRPATRFVAEFIGANNLLDVDITADSVRFDTVSLGPPHGVVQGQTGHCTLAIRPEAISIEAASIEQGGSPPQSQLQGRVVQQRTLGALIEHEIDIGTTVIKHTCFQGNAPAVAVDDTVSIGFDWSQVWCLPGARQ